MIFPWLLGEDVRAQAPGGACRADDDALFRPLGLAWCGCLASVIGALLGIALCLAG